jgi:hypothetical protein
MSRFSEKRTLTFWAMSRDEVAELESDTRNSVRQAINTDLSARRSVQEPTASVATETKRRRNEF